MSEAFDSLMAVMASRRSVREFSDLPIENEKLHGILQAARLAPSSNNTQPWRFVVVRDEGMRKGLSLAMPFKTPSPIKWMAKAPVVIACCAKPHVLLHKAVRVFGKDYSEVDAAIAVEHMVLAAAALGIGSCWVGWFSEQKVRQLLSIPSDVKVVALLPLGYPAEPTPEDFRVRPGPPGVGGLKATGRKGLEEMVWYEGWGEGRGQGQGKGQGKA
jgi:nitroreductase